MLGGKITVTGAPGLGTGFRVVLPLARADQKPSHDLPHLGGRVGLAGLSPATVLSAAAGLASADAMPIELDPKAPPPAGAVDVILVDAALAPLQIESLARRAPCLVVLRPEDRGAIARFRDLGCAGWLVRPLRASSLVERVYLAREGAVHEAPDIEPRAGGRVLIADDNPVNALIARRALESAGFTVTVAASGVEALESVETAEPDLILMDLRMPIMDGLEAMRRLRAAGRTMPIIAISAEVNPEVETDARAAGADLIAAKPIDPSALRELALSWTRRRAGAA